MDLQTALKRAGELTELPLGRGVLRVLLHFGHDTSETCRRASRLQILRDALVAQLCEHRNNNQHGQNACNLNGLPKMCSPSMRHTWAKPRVMELKTKSGMSLLCAGTQSLMTPRTCFVHSMKWFLMDVQMVSFFFSISDSHFTTAHSPSCRFATIIDW